MAVDEVHTTGTEKPDDALAPSLVDALKALRILRTPEEQQAFLAEVNSLYDAETTTMPPPAPRYPIGVMPAQSDHGDVHHLIVTRSNGDSVTVADLRWVHWRLTGRVLADWEIPFDWFAEEDR